jgi:hypothetical protein
MNESDIRKNLVNSLKKGNLQKILKVNKTGIMENPIRLPNCEIDVCFKTTNNKIVGIEVKSNVGLNVIMKGIGQALGYLKYCHASYIAIPHEYKDDAKFIIQKTPIGLITFAGKNFELIEKAKIEEPKNYFLIKNFDNPSNLWYGSERDDFIERIFEISLKKAEKGNKKEEGVKNRRVLFLHSLKELMVKSPKEYKEFEDAIKSSYLGQSEKEIIKFVEKFDKWFSFIKIINQAITLCKRYPEKYGKNEGKIGKARIRSSFQHSRAELIPLGIVEVKKNDNKFLYRINPVFIPKIYELLEKWELESYRH